MVYLYRCHVGLFQSLYNKIFDDLKLISLSSFFLFVKLSEVSTIPTDPYSSSLETEFGSLVLVMLTEDGMYIDLPSF